MPSAFSKRVVISTVVLFFLAGALMVFSATRPPKNFPANQVITVESGSSLSEIGKFLQEKRVIKYPFFLTNYVISLHREKGVISGDYSFKKPVGVFEVAKIITNGDFGIPAIKVTIPEGTSVLHIPEFFKTGFSKFDASQFALLAKGKEGFLFPDTYFFKSDVTAGNVIKKLEETFSEKTKVLTDDIKNSGKSLKEIITMASIVEEETKTPEDRRIVAGILWKRISIGMALQVDATLAYEVGKSTSELTTADLQKDSPYNTYTRRGLPPSPISNPGLDAILAVLHPTTTKYFYYLSDKKGEIHFAETYAGQLANKALYLH